MTDKNKKIAVLMSTYNGEKYVRDQLISILKQTYDNITVFIRDDGSTDNTLNVVNEIKNNNQSGKHIIILDDDYGNMGFGDSFRLLACSARGFDYYAFADQDDYWCKDKIERAVRVLDKQPGIGGVMYASNYYICDENLNPTHTFAEAIKLSDYSLAKVVFETKVLGFSCVIDESLKNEAFFEGGPDYIYSHDKWLSAIVVGRKKIFYYDSKPCAYFRRHNKSKSSSGQGTVFKAYWRIINVIKGNQLNKALSLISTFKDRFNECVNEEDSRFLEIFCDKSRVGRIRRCLYDKRLREKAMDELLIRILLLLE